METKHIVRSAYGKKERFGDIKSTGPSLTKQSFTKECDINNIMRKYQKTGAIEHVNKNQGSYGYATAHSFQEALEIVEKGEKMFKELPSSIRTKFENDPAQFLDFVQDPANIEEMQELGLAHKTDPNEIEQPIPAEKNAESVAGKSEPSGTAKSGSE